MCGCAWQVSPKDLREAAEALIKALMIREKYMAMALHSFPRTVAVFLQRLDRQAPLNDVQHEEPKTIEGTSTAYVRTLTTATVTVVRQGCFAGSASTTLKT